MRPSRRSGPIWSKISRRGRSRKRQYARRSPKTPCPSRMDVSATGRHALARACAPRSVLGSRSNRSRGSFGADCDLTRLVRGATVASKRSADHRGHFTPSKTLRTRVCVRGRGTGARAPDARAGVQGVHRGCTDVTPAISGNSGPWCAGSAPHDPNGRAFRRPLRAASDRWPSSARRGLPPARNSPSGHRRDR